MPAYQGDPIRWIPLPKRLDRSDAHPPASSWRRRDGANPMGSTHRISCHNNGHDAPSPGDRIGQPKSLRTSPAVTDQYDGLAVRLRHERPGDAAGIRLNLQVREELGIVVPSRVVSGDTKSRYVSIASPSDYDRKGAIRPNRRRSNGPIS